MYSSNAGDLPEEQALLRLLAEGRPSSRAACASHVGFVACPPCQLAVDAMRPPILEFRGDCARHSLCSVVAIRRIACAAPGYRLIAADPVSSPARCPRSLESEARGDALVLADRLYPAKGDSNEHTSPVSVFRRRNEDASFAS